jgi:hypothetical protein
MKRQEQHNHGIAPWLRWIARGSGTLVVGFWVFIATMGAIVEEEPLTTEALILLGLIGLSVIGIALAWWREGIGGAIVTACGVGHSIFATIAAGHNKVLAVLVAGAPLTVIGLLFLLIWWRTSKEEV